MTKIVYVMFSPNDEGRPHYEVNTYELTEGWLLLRYEDGNTQAYPSHVVWTVWSE